MMERTAQVHTGDDFSCMNEPTIDKLRYLGITYQSAPLAIREHLQTQPDVWYDIARQDRDSNLTNLLVLATCERFELYILPSRRPSTQWQANMAHIFGLSPLRMEKYVRSLEGEHAARHLFRVAAGLESRIIGEPHILCQLRQAFDKAKEAHKVGATLSALCRAAIHTGKRVRKETDINRHRQSIVSLTIQDMKRSLHCLQHKRVAIVGTGTLATGLALALKGCSNRIDVVSDSMSRARTLANRIDGWALSRISFLSQLSDFDAVIMCTTCSTYVLHHDMVAPARSGVLSIWDLSAPRSVEPSVGNLRGVKLMAMDDLIQGLPDRREGRKACESIVEQELSRLLTWSLHRRVAPSISRLIKIVRAQACRRGTVIDSRRLHDQIIRLKQEAAA